jgi:protein N-terminal methyltransferase
MSHADLVAFLRRSKAALRKPSLDAEMKDASAVLKSSEGYNSLIFVKENCCEDGPGGKPVEFLDEEDSSLTR